MASCNWMTKVDALGDFVALCAQVRHNPLATGIEYAIDITSPCPLQGGVWAAWSGEGVSSLHRYVSAHFIGRSRLVDAAGGELAEICAAPQKFGVVFDDELQVVRHLLSGEYAGDARLRTLIKDDIQLLSFASKLLGDDPAFMRLEARWLRDLDEVRWTVCGPTAR